MNKITIFMLAMACSQSLQAQEAEPIQNGRYGSKPAVMTMGQLNPIYMPIRSMSIPREVATIGDAIQYVLVGSGFRMVEKPLPDPYAYLLYDADLSESHRKISNLRLIDVLEMLGNPGYKIKINPVDRTISYTLSEGSEAYVNQRITRKMEQAKLRFESKEVLASTASLNSLENQSEVGVTNMSAIADKKPGQGGEEKQIGSDEGNLYQVSTNESLADVAKWYEGLGVTQEQALVAIFRENPDAFFGGNMNIMRDQAVLTLPTLEQVVTISEKEAQREVIRQWDKVSGSKDDEVEHFEG